MNAKVAVFAICVEATIYYKLLSLKKFEKIMMLLSPSKVALQRCS